ncbi:unnamed protein product [Musa acuminata subsp. burmannicoides]
MVMDDRSKGSVLEPSLLPDGIANAPEVAALEGAADPLVDRERRRTAPPQQLVRRDHRPPSAAFLALLLPPAPGAVAATAAVVAAEYLGPVRYVHRQGAGGSGIGDGAICLLAARGRRPGGRRRLRELGQARLDGASPDVGLLELIRVEPGGGRREEAVRRVVRRQLLSSPRHDQPSSRLCILFPRRKPPRLNYSSRLGPWSA